jgi:hypothetical protein
MMLLSNGHQREKTRSRNGTDYLNSRLTGHEAPTPKADAADRVNDGAQHHYGFGGLDLLRPFDLVALVAGLIRKTSRPFFI